MTAYAAASLRTRDCRPGQSMLADAGGITHNDLICAARVGALGAA